jgi:acetyl esterase/lipase
MLLRVFAILALVQALILVTPPLSWPLWMVRFGAIEGCLLAVVLGGVAVWGADGWWRLPGAIGVVIGLMPFVLSAPLYVREGVSFSPIAWLTGGATPQVTIERDVSIGGIRTDVYSDRKTPGPAVVVVHGGSWRAGDKGEVPHVSAALAASGYTVFDVRYRLAPFPAGLDDVRCVLATIAADPRVDPERIAVLGRSAGGQLALLSAYTDRPSPCGAVKVAAVVSIYGPTDLAWAHANPYVPDVVNGTDALEVYLGGTPAAAPDAYRDATPQRLVSSTSPPTLLVHGTAERCVRPDNATKLQAVLEAVGVPNHVLLVPFADHGFDVRRGGVGEQLSRGVILKFLAEHLGR